MNEKSKAKPSKKHALAIFLITVSVLLSTATLAGAGHLSATQQNIAQNIQAPQGSNRGTNQTSTNPILVIGNGAGANAMRSAMSNHGVSFDSNSILNLGQALSHQLVVIDSDSSFSVSDLGMILRNHTAIATIGDNKIGGLSSILTDNAMTFPFHSASKQSTALVIPSDISAYAVLFHPQYNPEGKYPTSNFVYQGSLKPNEIMTKLLTWLKSALNQPSSPQGSPPDPLPSFSPTTPAFIGNTKWITSSVNSDCGGGMAGQQEVMMDYWYTTTSNQYGTEYWILSYAQHTLEGFSNGSVCNYSWVPTTSLEYLDGETSSYQGQILASYNPSASGCSNPPSYTIGVGPDGPTASVTYNTGGINLCWNQSGDLSKGQIQWNNGYGSPGSPSATNQLIYTQPSAILELDPQFPGGYLPFDDYNAFDATFCAQNVFGGCSSDYQSAPEINFSESIYTDHISFPGPTTIEIYTYPTTDTYCRSVGLAIDQALPNPWWPPYQSGFEINSSACGSWTYYTYPNLLTGSHYLQTAVSGFTPSYAWHTIVYVNGAWAGEGDVGRNQILQVNFNV